jgi:hypothetical protein
MMENGRTRTPLSFPGLGARAPILGMLDPLPHLPQRSRMLSTPSMTRRLGVPTRVIISLHLGQKPKLGGRYIDISLIYISYLVDTLYIHVAVFFLSFFLIVYLLLLHSKTQKDQKYFCCFSSFVSLSFSISLLSFKIRFVIQKSKNILLYWLFLFALVSKTRKPKNICCFFLVLYSVFRVGQPSVTPMELGFHSYHSKQHK